MLARVAQVGIDQQRAFAELREDDGEVGGGEAAAICPARADDGQRLVADFGVEPAQHELAAHGAQLFDDGAEGLEGGDDFFADALVTGHQIGIVVLAGERLLDVGLGEQAKLDGGVAKAQALLFLQLEDALGGVRRQAAVVDEDGTDGASGTGVEFVGHGVHVESGFRRSRLMARFEGGFTIATVNRLFCPKSKSSFCPGQRGIEFGQHRQVERQGEVFGRTDAALAEFEDERGANAEHAAEENGNQHVEEDLGPGVLGRLSGRAEHEHVGLLRLAFEIGLHHALANGLVGAAGGFDVVDQHGEFIALRAQVEYPFFLFFDRLLEFVLLYDTELAGDGVPAGDTADFLTQLLALLGDLGFELLDLRMILAEVAADLRKLRFGPGDFGFEALDQRVLQDFEREFAGAALLPAGGVGTLGLGSGELHGQVVEAGGFVVHHAFVGNDDAFFLLVGGKAGLGFFEVGAQAFLALFKPGAVLAGRLDAHFDGGVDIGLGKGVGNGGGKNRVGAGEAHADHIALAGRLDV